MNGVEVTKAYMNGVEFYTSEVQYYLNLSKDTQDELIVGDNDYGTDFVDRSYSYGVEFEKTLEVPASGTNDLIMNNAFSAQKVGIGFVGRNLFLYHTDNGSLNVPNFSIDLSKTIVQKIDVTYDKPTTTLKLLIDDVLIYEDTSLLPLLITPTNPVLSKFTINGGSTGIYFDVRIKSFYVNDNIQPCNEGVGFDTIATTGRVSTGETSAADALNFWNSNVWQLCETSKGDPVNVFFGQSNMAGRGVLTEAPIEEQALIPNSKIWNTSTDQWDDLDARTVSDRPDNYSLIIHFAYEKYLAEPSKTHYYFVQAFGGTAMYDKWNINTTNTDFRREQFYDIFTSGNFYCDTIFWLQGESDCDTLAHANAYEQSEADMINFYKQQYLTDNFITCKLGFNPPTSENLNFKSEVNQAKQNNFNNGICSAIIETDGYELSSDELHFTTQGYIDIADELFTTYNNL